MRSSVRSSLLLLAAVLAAVGLAACGGGGGGSTGDSSTADDATSPEDEAKLAAVRAVENGDAKSFCRDGVSKGCIAKVYGGDVKKCVGAKGEVPEPVGKAEATAAVLEPDGLHAAVTVSISGGSLEGSEGEVKMVKERPTWRLDDYGDEFIRSSFLASIETADKGALATPELKACFSRQVKGLPVETIRHLTYASDADEQKELDEGLIKLAHHCPESALAEYGARTLTEGIKEKGKHDHAYVVCLHRDIKFGLEVSKITTELLVPHPGFAAVAALEGIVEGAKRSCEG